MKILALTRYFPPEIGTASHLFYELCETLTGRGHKVTVVTGMPWYNLSSVADIYKKRLLMTEVMDGIKVIRAADMPLPWHGLRIKLGHFSAPLSLGLAALQASKPDIMIFYSPPLLFGLSAYFLAKKWKIPFVMNLQDLYPLCLMDYGYPSALITVLEKMELFIYRQASIITVHSEGNRDYLLDVKKQPAAKVQVVPNWVDTDIITPGSRDNSFRERLGLGNAFIVSFAGTMGAAQGLRCVIDTAQHLKEYPDIKFLLVGGGMEKESLVHAAEMHGLTNVIFYPMQPKEVYPDILGASDVCLSTLVKNFSAPVVPSKILSIMAAGRPVLASMPLKGDAPKLIHEAQCGLCVEPGNPEALAQAILTLYRHPELRDSYGVNGRRYAEEHFSRGSCVAKYEALFQEAISRYRGQHTAGGK